jgi:cytochrome c oxidase subunit 2
VAELQGCQDCHSLDGSEGKAPTWLGLYGTEEKLVDGTTVVVDDEYLRRSIVDAGAEIVEGYGNTMPPRFGEVLSEQEIEDLIEYIESLSEAEDD